MAPRDELAIEQNPDYQLVDTWASPALGTVEVFLSRNRYILFKKLELQRKFAASPSDLRLLEQRLKELPEEVTLASSSYVNFDPNQPLFVPGDPVNKLYLEYSSRNLKKEVSRRSQAGERSADAEAMGIFGFLLGLGSFMEQGLEFHRSVCLKNLLIVDGRLQLTNPYVSDSHISLVLKVGSL